MRLWVMRASVLLVLAVTACNHATPIYNVPSAEYNATESLSDVDAEKAIKTAGTRLGWTMSKLEPGLIRATLNLRSHVAVVDIAYDDRGYAIDYVDSENLKYDETEGEIHKSYNKWIRNLERYIALESGNV